MGSMTSQLGQVIGLSVPARYGSEEAVTSMFHTLHVFNPEADGSSSVRSAMVIVDSARRIQAPSGAACNELNGMRGHMPLLTELGNWPPGLRSYKHAAPDGASRRASGCDSCALGGTPMRKRCAWN
jgi:hypothetical protein